MLTLNFNPFPTLTTDRLVLRQQKESDKNELFFLRSDKEVIKYLDKDPAPSVDEAVEFILKTNDLIAKNESIVWGITLKDDPTLIGNIALWRIIKEHYRAEIGYTLHPAHQQKGIMNEAFKPVLEYGFKQMNLHSIEANVNPNNAASIKLLEKNGFIKEAHFRENYYHNGRFLDSAIYSLLSTL